MVEPIFKYLFHTAFTKVARICFVISTFGILKTESDEKIASFSFSLQPAGIDVCAASGLFEGENIH
jgi:hypothetical protein